MYKKLVLINDITDNVSDWLNEMRASMANKRSSHGAVDVIKDEIELFKVQMHLHVYFMQDTCFCFRVNGKSVNHEVQMFFFFYSDRSRTLNFQFIYINIHVHV